MNYDEFAFFNQQLGAMLRDGIPLEEGLKELSAGMRDPALRSQLQLLEADLAKGTPLPEALARRQVPELFRRMVEIGAKTNDLPGVLTLLADHYHRSNALWTRLKGLMVYPLIVVCVTLILTLVLSIIYSRVLPQFYLSLGFYTGLSDLDLVSVFGVWAPPVLMAIVAIILVLAVSLPGWRRKLRWRLPAFREASLANLASAISLMLRKGMPLSDTLALAELLESGSPAALRLAQWRDAIKAGQGKPSQWTGAPKPFPPLFLWLVQKSGEDVAAGFDEAAELYRARAAYRIELALYGALPVSILFLGQMVLWQVAPVMRAFVRIMNAIGGV